MDLLLDSHVALWWVAGDSALGSNAVAAIVEADQVFVSVVTPWELGIKRASGKLEFPSGLTAELTDAGFSMLPIFAQHAEAAPVLPTHHRDPFDRMLIAQARFERLQIVTADAVIRNYEVEVLDAER